MIQCRHGARLLGVTLKLFLSLWLVVCGWWVQFAHAQPLALHQGPSLHMTVQRGQQRLPLRLVPQLKAGDVVWVEPLADRLAEGDWVLMLASTSPTGTQVQSKFFDVRSLKGPASFEMASDGLALVVVLAPQLRNLFGLNTSLQESSSILKDVLTKDPQRFVDLQRVDQINQAITLMGNGLTRRIEGQTPADAKQITLEWASQYGASSIDPQCFQSGGVNVVCVAHSLVAGKNFSLPSTNDLSAIVGLNKSVDLNSLLTANLKFFSDAGEYLGSKYRDTYDFAPTYGQREPDGDRINLFSVSRLRSGKVKTAYIFVPTGFQAPAPQFQFNPLRPLCLNAGVVAVRALDAMPLLNHWHDWQLALTSGGASPVTVNATRVNFNRDEGLLVFDVPSQALRTLPPGQPVTLAFRARFGFDPVTLPLTTAALPLPANSSVLQQLVQGQDWVAGASLRLSLPKGSDTACVQKLALKRDGVVWAESAITSPTQLDVNLTGVQPGPVVLEVTQVGAPVTQLPLAVLAAPAVVDGIEHPVGERWLRVKGQRLNRIQALRVGEVMCAPAPGDRTQAAEWRFDCPVTDAQALMVDQVSVLPLDPKRAAQSMALTQRSALPRVVVASDRPQAVLAVPSEKFRQWHLSLDAPLVSDDSGLHLLLKAVPPYQLQPGVHELQARYAGDPLTQQHPLRTRLLADWTHHEMRTIEPLRFDAKRLPSVINPIEFRVVNQTTGEHSNWERLGKSVVLLPRLQAHTCQGQPPVHLIHGEHLDLIDQWTLINSQSPEATVKLPSTLTSCSTGLCQALPLSPELDTIRVSLRWVDAQSFTVTLPQPDASCQAETSNSLHRPGGHQPAQLPLSGFSAARS